MPFSNILLISFMIEIRSTKFSIRLILAFCAIVCAIAARQNHFDFSTVLAGVPDWCLFLKLTGYKCPGCGMTHAVLCLLSGMPLKAVLWNPFILVIVPFFLIREKVSKLDRRVFYSIMALTISFGIFRNLI